VVERRGEEGVVSVIQRGEKAKMTWTTSRDAEVGTHS
jgi:hypothetical protein